MSRTLLERFADIEFVTNVSTTIMATGRAKTSLNRISCLNMEEADGRLVLHLQVHGTLLKIKQQHEPFLNHFLKNNFLTLLQDAVENTRAQNMVVRSSDTDVLVLLVSFFPSLRQKGLTNLWLQFGVGSKRRFISIHRIVEVLGDDRSEALLGFHAFSGCDLTSFFGGKGKRTAFSAWDRSFDAAFKEISRPLNEVSATVFEALEKYTVKMYGESGTSEVSLSFFSPCPFKLLSQTA